MIVNHVPTGWQIIYQQAHALLAAQLLHQWPAFLPCDQWVGLLAAAAQHDDEQQSWDGHYGLTPAGAPANFTMKEFSLEQATGVMKAARFQGRWRSLLTSLHLSTLYESLRGQKAETDAFLDEQQASQKRWLRELQIKKADAQRAYTLLHWCDRLSLILCRHELPEMGRALEIYQGPDGQGYQVLRPEPEGPVRVQPWPFRDKQFIVSVEATVLHQLQFTDDAELAAALREAPIELLTWVLTKG
ncbi:hypothetical protein HNQ93_000876 [Hymenobacter luteus]|uniref:DUF3891 family protein n=2 Tax=Hymenobacter TaxID=89966 RepID=A0A7W9SYE4_9BACT|nr:MULTISPECIES: DUF3891 family protein [Hymenobacter]MBB4599644.1 hypothetical protein [Hymenobacter latericoloratus]MBB6058046.1 hypothetical protein [Hymenobacter luteus]